MKRSTIPGLILACSLTLVTALPAAGQWSLEGRVGSAMPAGELTHEPTPNQTAGLSFAADLMYNFGSNVTVYGGASRQAFNCQGCTTDVVSAGFDGGMKFLFSTNGPATPWARGGLVLSRSSIDGVDHDWGFGVDSGIGVDWRLNPRVSAVPALRLNSYSSGPLSLTYVTMDLGLHLHLAR
jgi:hypothetical protein